MLVESLNWPLAALAFAALASSCSCKDKKTGGGSPGEPGLVEAGEQPDAGSGASPVTRVVNEVITGSGFPLTRVAPEQLSLNVVQATGFDGLINTDNDTGQSIDYLQALFGVPLGGIDFVSAARRDPSTKAQTLLVSRVVAWQIAQQAIWADHQRPDDEQRMFVKCLLKTDRPFTVADANGNASAQTAARASEARWDQQVDELFYRFYTRPPTPDEKAAVKTAFMTALDQQGYPPSAWVIVLYAMMSSQEFWHI